MENQRIRLTKRMLKEALVRLLNTKQIEHISVSELCAEAQINRTTFYKYYGSQFDLMNDIQADFMRELENSLQKNARPVSLLNTLTYIDTHRELCTVLLHTAADSGFLERIFSFSPIAQQLEEQVSRQYPDCRKEYVKEFVIYGSYSVIRKWLLSEQPEPPETITEIILKLIETI